MKIIRSETFSNNANIDTINYILNECIKDLIENENNILNIQVVEYSGDLRYWIYVKEK
jgi:hypothetical protein